MKAEKSGDWTTSSRATSGPHQGSWPKVQRLREPRQRAPHEYPASLRRPRRRRRRRHSLICGESRRDRIKSRVQQHNEQADAERSALVERRRHHRRLIAPLRRKAVSVLGGLLEPPESPSRHNVTRKGEREGRKERGLGNEQPSDQWTRKGAGRRFNDYAPRPTEARTSTQRPRRCVEDEDIV